MLGYKYRTDIERDIDSTLALNKLYAPNRELLNDPTEMNFDDSEFVLFLDQNKKFSGAVRKQYDEILNLSRNKCGVFSLSKNFDNELQWAYYADGHRGFCIEYDTDVIMESYNYSIRKKNGRLESMPLVHRIEVDYHNEFAKFTPDVMKRLINTNDYTEVLTCTLGTKSENWEKEKEVRLIFNKSGLVELDYRAVKGIYFGCRFDNSSNKIEEIMRKLRGRGVRYYQMKFNKNSYTLKRNEIKDRLCDSSKYTANNLPYEDIKCTSGPKLYEPNKDLIEKALKYVSQEPCINKIRCSYIELGHDPKIVIEAYVNPDFINPDIIIGNNIKYYRFSIDFSDRSITLQKFQRDLL